MLRKIRARMGIAAFSVLLLTLASIIVATAQSQPVASGTVFDGLANYAVVKTRGGHLRVYVNVPFENPGVLDAYINENRRAAEALTKGSNRDVFIVVTLKRPVSIEHASELIATTGIQVTDVIFAMRDADGRKAIVGMSLDGVFDAKSLSIPIEDGQTMLGIILISGHISSRNLSTLWRAPEVLLADAVSAQIEGQLSSRPSISLSMLQWAVPSPFWDLPW